MVQYSTELYSKNCLFTDYLLVKCFMKKSNYNESAISINQKVSKLTHTAWDTIFRVCRIKYSKPVSNIVSQTKLGRWGICRDIYGVCCDFSCRVVYYVIFVYMYDHIWISL